MQGKNLLNSGEKMCAKTPPVTLRKIYKLKHGCNI